MSILSVSLFTGCTSELDKHINSCKEDFPIYAESMSEIQSKWEDTFEIAISTSRISLAGPVGNLQNIRREASKVTAPDCIADSHENYLEGMDTFIDIFLDFMSDADAEPDELDINIAQLQILGIASVLERYEDDPEVFFEELRELAATATAESTEP